MTSITYNTGSAGTRVLTARARNSGELDLPALNAVSLPGTADTVTFRAETNGVVDINALDPLPAGVTLSVATGGAIINPNAKSAAHKSASAGDVVVADLSGDGLADSAEAGAWVVTVTLAGGAVTQHAVGESPVHIAVADLNGDGLADLVTANGNGGVAVLYGAGGGAFYSAEIHGAGGTAVSVAPHDVDNDGYADLIVELLGEEEPVVLYGSESGVFSARP